MLVMTIGAVVSAGPSMAHTDLVSTAPVAGATLTKAPAAVVLTFNEDLLPDTVSVSISDASSGEVLAADPAELSGAVVTAPWPIAATGGNYLIAYRVVSGDGHPVTGSIDFTIEPSAEAPTSPAPATAASTPEATPAAPASASAPAPAPATDTSSPAASAASTPPWALIAIVMVLAAVVIVVLVISANRRRRISRE